MTKTMIALMATMIAVSSLSIIPAKASVSGFAVDQQTQSVDKRSKPRVPGGSGCDDPRDLIEHPECNP